MITIILSANYFLLGSLDKNNTFSKAGFYFDISSVLFLVSMLVLTFRIPAYNYNIKIIRIGFVIWIAGKTFDLSDEFIQQSIWVAFYFEDLLINLGMFIVCFFSFKLIRKLDIMYSEANITSFRDELTTLPNRRFFIRSLEELKDEVFFLIIIDIDHFKTINDTYGHDVGDIILNEFGSALSTFMNKFCMPARIGGEEFAILINNMSRSQVEILSTSIFNASKKIIIHNGKTLSVTMGIGEKKKNEPVEELLKRVDVALYSAKNSGRGKIEWSL